MGSIDVGLAPLHGPARDVRQRQRLAWRLGLGAWLGGVVVLLGTTTGKAVAASLFIVGAMALVTANVLRREAEVTEKGYGLVACSSCLTLRDWREGDTGRCANCGAHLNPVFRKPEGPA